MLYFAGFFLLCTVISCVLCEFLCISLN
jgi:hypothetical protein